MCAEDAINGLTGILNRLGGSRAMVICGPSILAKSDVVHRVQSSLGGVYVGLFQGVAPHSPVNTLDEAMELVADLKPGMPW